MFSIRKIKPKQLIGILLLVLTATIFITLVNLNKKPKEGSDDEELIDPKDENIINQMNKGGQDS